MAWLDLVGKRPFSEFERRHLVSINSRYVMAFPNGSFDLCTLDGRSVCSIRFVQMLAGMLNSFNASTPSHCHRSTSAFVDLPIRLSM